MRLHRLEVTALGPFAGTETVDLDRLGADGLFLLHGETGAGKTSVLDAIAYALFGRVPGSRQQAGRLRCDQAGPDVAPSVRLELTLAGRRLRVRRSPEWRRPKRRGVGTTRQPASAVLHELRDGAWIGLSTRIDEVSQQLLDWIGMSAEQFFQVVLLPQGDFARFLRAESSEREALLERLFGTRRFAEVQDWLADRRGNAKLVLEKAESELHIWLQRLCQELGVERSEVPSVADASAAWRAEQVRVTEQAVAVAENGILERASVMAAARAAAEDTRTRRRLQERRMLAERELAGVTAGRAEYERVRDRDAAARRAAVMPPLLAALDAAQRERLACESAVERRLRSVAVLIRGLDLRPGHDAGAKGVADLDIGDADGLTLLERRLRAECARLAGLAEQAAERDDGLAELTAIEVTVADIEVTADALLQRHEALPLQIADAARREAAASAAAAVLPGLRAATGRSELAVQSAAAEVAILATLVAAEDRLRAAVDRHQASTTQVLQLRERRLYGMAAELAGALAEGEACPVCGSCEHPAPADRAAAAVTDAAETAAAEAQAHAATARVAVEEEVQFALTTLAEHRGRSGGRGVAELTAERDRLRRELAEAQDAAEDLSARAAATVCHQQERESLGALLAEAQSTKAERLGRAAELRAAIAKIDRRLDAARGQDPSLPARIARLGAAADDIADLHAALQADSAARSTLAKAVAAADKHATRAGFATVAEAAKAVGSSEELALWQQLVDGYERRAAALGQLLAEPGLDDPDVIASARSAQIDLVPTVEAQLAAETAHSDAVAVLTGLRRRAVEVRRLTERLAEAEQAAAPARTEYADVRALADLVAGLGQNTRHMTLRAYVLAARLAEVADSASRRLKQMSGDRYTFQHTDVADSSRVRAGLGLVVVDDYSGLARSTKTLSGGESFLASLALALGLADVVTAEAGGVQLETLFIDEGFGSLDAETLDQVMSTLDELRAGGRVVGVVSHVEEMRARIPSRLLVHKRREGSTLEQISA
ncbi:MAG: AAA family ATPase [Geodermatophilaceae bacterium]